ncbi:DMT family transporter [Stygiobacter electus]|uniref:DMT family transporter n=1 Tax=Stygiobacter electus TaxID=3032292 RepID=A0AAE3TBS2_9BACT|nr:DMT family transporter [Stygiobacter electus]MDF1611145.1 DMT family transporter [Stygiobacter electus]
MEKFSIDTIFKVHVPLLIVQLSFGALPPITKLALVYFNPMSVVFFRIVSTAILFSFIFFIFKKEQITDKKHFYQFALFGFFGVAGNQLFYLAGLSITNAVNAGILVTTIPIFTLIVAVILKKEELSLLKVLGIVIAFSGVAYLIDFGRFSLNENLLGDVFIIFNSCFYAVYLVISKKMLKIYNSFTVITYVFIFASFMILPFTIPSLFQIDYSSIPINGYISLSLVLIVGTFIPYITVTFALQNTQSSSVAIYSYLQPLIATVLSSLIIGEKVSIKIIISAAIIISGVSFVTFAGIIKFNKTFSKLFNQLDYNGKKEK